MATDTKITENDGNVNECNLSHRPKRIITFTNRKTLNKNNNKMNNKNNTKTKPQHLTEIEVNEIHNSLLKAISNCNKLTDAELIKIFANALDHLNGSWFRHNLSSLFIINNNGMDIISFILRLFTLNFELSKRRYNVPLRYLLLDLIAPSLHHQSTNHKTANLLHPLPKMTNYHRSNALQIFNLWINDHNNHLRLREICHLFHAFNLHEILSNPIRDTLCNKIYNLLNDDAVVLAIKWTMSFNLIDYIPYKLLLQPLLHQQSLLHYALNYIDLIKGNNNKHQVKQFIICTISKLLLENKTNISACRAVKLIQNWNLDLTQKEFEPLTIEQIKKFLKWIICRGLIDDYVPLICDYYADNDRLKYFIIQQCSRHPCAYKSCVKWAKYWNLHSCNDIVLNCQIKIQQQRVKVHVHNNYNKNVFIAGFDDIEYCVIKDEESQIIFVDSMERLSLACDILLNGDIKCIGLDLELMAIDLPWPINKKPKHCQILQIATSDIAFIFDLQINEIIDNKVFDHLLLTIFKQSSIVKIGIGWQHDLCQLQKQYPNCAAFQSILSPYFELSGVSKYIMNNKQDLKTVININEKREKNIKNRFKRNKDKEGGLGRITRWILNKKLNKFQQISNWSNRPLRKKQLQYAALDSMVQCWIYEKLSLWQKKNVLPLLNCFYNDLNVKLKQIKED